MAIRGTSLPSPNPLPWLCPPTGFVVAVRAAGGVAADRCTPGVHVRLVVVADVQHVVAPLEHARQAAQADVHRAAVAALRHHPHVVAALDAQRRRDTAGHGGRVAEQRVQPR